MIRSFAHKGLERFYRTGSKKGIQPGHAKKLRLQLSALDTAFEIGDMAVPGWRLHPLVGDRKGRWSISVSGNWRLVFGFENGHATEVTYEDYH